MSQPAHKFPLARAGAAGEKQRSPGFIPLEEPLTPDKVYLGMQKDVPCLPADPGKETQEALHETFVKAAVQIPAPRRLSTHLAVAVAFPPRS